MAGKPETTLRSVIWVLLLLPLVGFALLLFLVPLFANTFVGFGIELPIGGAALGWAARHPVMTTVVVVLLAVTGLVVRRRRSQQEGPTTNG